MKINPPILLFILITIASLLRLYHLDTIPFGFHNDEASFFVNANLLKSTGRDEDSRLLPLYLNSYIDPKPALISYLQIPAILIFGNTVTAARTPHAIIGIISILLTYRFVTLLTKDKRIPLLVVFLLTFSPWHLMLSRGTQEVITSFTFFIAALIALIKWIKSLSTLKYLHLCSYGLFGFLAMYTYHASKVVLPIVAVLTVLRFKSHLKSLTKTMLIIIVFSIILFCISVELSGGLNRLRDTNVFTDGGAQLVLNEQTRVATNQLPVLLIRVFHNKVVNYGVVMLGNYLDHFSPSFIFLTGGMPARYIVPQHGLIYLMYLPILMYGLILGCLKWRTDKNIAYFTFWLVIAPIPAAITYTEIPSSVRTAIMIIPLAYFIALGLVGLIDGFRKYKYVVLILFSLTFIWSLCYFVNQASIQFKYFSSRHRNVAEWLMAEKLDYYYPQYTSFVIERLGGTQPYIYLTLRNHITSKELQSSFPQRLNNNFSINKFYMTTNSCPLGDSDSTLYIVHEACVLPASEKYADLTQTNYFHNSLGQIFKKIDEAQYIHGSDGFIFLEWVESRDPKTDSVLMENQ